MRRLLPFLIIALIVLCSFIGLFIVPGVAARSYGPPSAELSFTQTVQYSAKLVWDDGLLTQPLAAGTSEETFTVQPGESIASVGNRLVQAGLIRDASMLRDYLIYSGLDTSIQAGDYRLSPAMSIIGIARAMQDATPADITFVILPGWRLEEIAASLPTSGLNITPGAFLDVALSPHQTFDFLADAPSTEGFLFPDSYVLPRATTVDEFVDGLIRNFAQHLTRDLHDGFGRQGLSDYQGVTLAAIVERETIQPEEAPLIASVYLNRLNAHIRLEADPTVQYALGYNSQQQSWWTNPLSAADLKYASSYNTYLGDGLPPGPIDNPSLNSLQAVAAPASSSYYYFRARCDASGYHNFSRTFEEHLQNACP
jgi:UPF0755 protein